MGPTGCDDASMSNRDVPASDGDTSMSGYEELMAEKKVLDFKPTWWLEQIGYERCK
jgi:hypothetical protein